MKKYWIVTKYGHTTSKWHGAYPYWVEGYHSDDEKPFFWTVPDLEGFDFSKATFVEKEKEQ